MREICARYDFAYYGNWGLILSGWCAGGADGADQIQAGLDRLRDQGALARQPYYLSLLAETLMRAGQGEAAGAVLEAARTAAAVHDDRWWLPELYRLDAQRRPRRRPGPSCCATPSELAGQQGAACWPTGPPVTWPNVVLAERSTNDPRTLARLRVLSNTRPIRRPAQPSGGNP